MTVDFQMPSKDPVPGVKSRRVDIHQQHCTLSPVTTGKNPKCSVNFTDSIGEPDHAVKGSTTYLPNAKGRAATISIIAAPLSPAIVIITSAVATPRGQRRRR
jgi:hypothetical protein